MEFAIIVPVVLVVLVIFTVLTLMALKKRTSDTICGSCRYSDVPANLSPCRQCLDEDDHPRWRKR